MRTIVRFEDNNVGATRGSVLSGSMLYKEDAARISVLQAITAHQSLIISEAVSDLAQDTEEYLQKGSKLYINHHFPSFSQDMQDVLKHISYMMFGLSSSESQFREEISSMKSRIITQGFPISDLIKAIESLREVTLRVLSSNDQLTDLLSDSSSIEVRSATTETITEIKERYSNIWVAIEVVELEKGFPKAGKVLLASRSRNKVAEELSKQYRNLTTYTFYCDDSDASEDPVTAKIKSYLDPYFDVVVQELSKDI